VVPSNPDNCLPWLALAFASEVIVNSLSVLIGLELQLHLQLLHIYISVKNKTGFILFRVPQEDPSGRTIILEAGEFRRIKVS